jgi:hypothetical protein
MKSLKVAAINICLLIILSGCSLPGRWESVSFKPDVAKNKFRLLGPAGEGLEFRKTILTLNKDKSYSAETYYGTYVELSDGKWERQDGKLTLIDKLGNPYKYNYKIYDGGNSLRLTRQLEGTDMILELHRTPYKKENK